MNQFDFKKIGVIRSPWKEKFAVPRQPGLITEGGGELELLPPYNHPDSIRGLENFSHLWVMFIFHQTMQQGWKPLVRPPRLGGNQRIGVFASRSTFRPNPLGMSLVSLTHICCEHQRVILKLGSLDLVDGTPVVDIKPYLPFAEALPEAWAGYAQHAPEASMPVTFSEEATRQVQALHGDYPQLASLIQQVLAQDPRPAYRKNHDDPRVYAANISDFNIRWQVVSAGTVVLTIGYR